MLFQILFFIVFGILSALTFWMPGYGEYPLPLPWGTDSLFQTMSSYYHGAIETLPYLEVVLEAFGYALLFEIALVILRLFIGHRAPTNTN